MLIELSIRDLALIETLDLEFGPGLNALTGETGAGKSLLVGSLELLVGQTPKGGAGKWVRKGAGEARVEGRFEIRGAAAVERVTELLRAEVPALAEVFEESVEGDVAELLLGRSLTAAGRTKAHVQQRPVPLRALRVIAPAVLEIHGQNDHQRLLEPAEQLHLLDAYGGLAPELASYRDARRAWRELVERFEKLDAERAERRDRRDLVAFQLEELEAAELQVGEHERLREERDLLRSAAELRGELGAVADELAQSEGALLDRLRSALHVVDRWQTRLGKLEAPLEDLRSAEIHVAEAASVLASFADGVSDDPARLDVLEERLSELERLQHKYRCDEAGLLELQAALEAERTALASDEESLSTLEAEIDAALQALTRSAARLAKKRRALVPKLVKGVQASLAALGLARARLDVRATPRTGDDPSDVFGPAGAEDVELLLAANPGEDLSELRHVASGGEAARIMLALRTELLPREAGGAGRTVVFDEIDSGVGGRLGPEVGTHLKRLAQTEQVLCVTHIPAIAAAADRHLCTTKEVHAGRTRTTVVALEGAARVDEVADMIAGGSAHETARAEAERLLIGANG